MYSRNLLVHNVESVHHIRLRIGKAFRDDDYVWHRFTTAPHLIAESLKLTAPIYPLSTLSISCKLLGSSMVDGTTYCSPSAI